MEQAQTGFIDNVLRDLGGAFGIAPVRIGGALGLYRTLAEKGPMTSAELAAETGLAERYLREWLSHQAASGYLDYAPADGPADGRFALPADHVDLLARPESTSYILPAFDAAAAYLENQDKVQEAFRTGAGVAWGDQAGCLACAVAEFFRPGYRANLVDVWLPALDGVVEKLERGAKVADIGCGHGLSTVMMAEAFPNSAFVGIDLHGPSIEEARSHARRHGGVPNLEFRIGRAQDFPGSGYDLVAFFDCLHDMGDPVGAARRVRRALAPDGTWMIVEPFAHDALEDNLTPVGRLYYAASTMTCVPGSLAQEVGAALGAQAGERRLCEVARSGGFDSVRRAAETPFNLILEARR